MARISSPTSACLLSSSSAVWTSLTVASVELSAALVASTHCSRVLTPLVNSCIPTASSSLRLLSAALFSSISHRACTSAILSPMLSRSAGKLWITSAPNCETCPTLSLIGASSRSSPLCFRWRAFTVVRSWWNSSSSSFSDFSVIQSQTSSHDLPKKMTLALPSKFFS